MSRLDVDAFAADYKRITPTCRDNPALPPEVEAATNAAIAERNALEVLETTITRALSDAERASIVAALQAHECGDIAQREIAPGIFVLVRS
jgi:hypothetical protein